MRYSKLFGKTNKSAKEFESKNATLLIKGGFVNQLMAGVYSYLPLGMRVLSRVEAIVKDEMNKIAQEIVMPAISPRENWIKTSRDQIDVLIQTNPANEASKKRNDASYILNPTHEDVVTPLVKEYVTSYRDLPIALYQIQNKFRNEARAKSGLMRGREFRMKDLYSFHTNETDFERYFEKIKEYYTNVFNRLGIGDRTFMTLASGGDFTKKYSVEFQTKCDAGEDLIFFDKAKNIYYNREVTSSRVPKYNYSNEIKEFEEVFGEGIVSVERLVEFLKVPIEECVKTLIYADNDNKFYAVGIRGDREVDEDKLKKILSVATLRLASEEEIKSLTGAEVGYAGSINLPEEISIVCDDSIESMTNFEIGGNRTNYHIINANWGRDIKLPERFYDIKVAEIGDLIPETGVAYLTFKAAEVGNIFPLESKFPDAFDFKFIDEDGLEQKIVMGSYGIGTTRLVGVIAEIFNDERGLVWPESVAPFQVHLIGLNLEDESIRDATEKIYNLLLDNSIEVLYDDRVETRAGEKFADADLIGNPWRIVVSKQSLEQGGLEVKRRDSEKSEIKTIDSLIVELKN